MTSDEQPDSRGGGTSDSERIPVGAWIRFDLPGEPSLIAFTYLDPEAGFYLKLVDMEARGAKTLDNYQNFAKAFKVRDFRALMGSQKANQARLKSAVEFGRTEMSEGSELYQTVLRAVATRAEITSRFSAGSNAKT